MNEEDPEEAFRTSAENLSITPRRGVAENPAKSESAPSLCTASLRPCVRNLLLREAGAIVVR